STAEDSPDHLFPLMSLGGFSPILPERTRAATSGIRLRRKPAGERIFVLATGRRQRIADIEFVLRTGAVGSRHDVPRLGLLEVLPQPGVQAVAHAQDLGRVEGPLGEALFHLDPASAALGGADLEVIVLEPAEQLAPRAEGGAELLAAD